MWTHLELTPVHTTHHRIYLREGLWLGFVIFFNMKSNKHMQWRWNRPESLKLNILYILNLKTFKISINERIHIRLCNPFDWPLREWIKNALCTFSFPYVQYAIKLHFTPSQNYKTPAKKKLLSVLYLRWTDKKPTKLVQISNFL